MAGEAWPRSCWTAGRSAPASRSDDEPGEGDKLSDDDLVDIDEGKKKTDVDEALSRLDEDLVGLVPVKTKVREITALLLVDRMRRRFDLASQRPTLHMSLTGSPGTGKTTVAIRMGEQLNKLGPGSPITRGGAARPR